ncbi:MAG TPA: UDP-N-acetylmuramoyl-tripeptide--D-alanyl-D-alanine ligase [Streptosporangiaceae bacterium]|jgi:UDP-N-acetylmuramoyl-tripeptide--D-alanyl-D-alanine ligase
MSVAQVAGITGAALDAVPDPGALVTGPVVIDSRAARPGGLFAALPGEHVDGHDYAAAAAAAGAVAVLATRPCGAPALLVPDVPAALAALAAAVVRALPDLTIVGITGSAGKTTTKDLTAQLVETLGPTVAPRGSYNNEIGHPLTVLGVTGETQYLISELSARGPGHIAALCQVAPPRLGAVLCVGHAHAGEFGGIEQVALAKSELPAALPADGVAVLNADDPRVAAMAARTAARVVTFGTGSGAGGRPDVRADGVTTDELGRASFTLVTPAGAAPVRLRLHGAHHVSNALAAAALAAELGMAPGAIAAGLSAAVARSRWRMEVTERDDGVMIVNDAYNANPESVRAALAALADMTAGGRRGFAVLGQMTELGEESQGFHEEVGRLAAQAGVAALIVVGEAAGPILAGTKSVPSWSGELLHVADAPAAARALEQRLSADDVVLVKASHSVGLQAVALALTGEQPFGEPAP